MLNQYADFGKTASGLEITITSQMLMVKINDPLNEAVRMTMTANIDRETARIIALTDHVDILSQKRPNPV